MTGNHSLAAVTAVVALLIASGALLVRCGDPTPDDPTGAGLGPDRHADDVAARSNDHGRDEADAVEAAMAYASASQDWLYLTDDQIRAEIAKAATPRAADALASGVVERIAKAREGLAPSSGRIWWLVRPLATRVGSHSADQARVDVWIATVLSAAEVAAPQTEWLTLEVDLEWVRNGWRVDAVRETPGPTPLPGPEDDPWDAGDFDKALDGFVRVDGEPLP